MRLMNEEEVDILHKALASIPEMHRDSISDFTSQRTLSDGVKSAWHFTKQDDNSWRIEEIEPFLVTGYWCPTEKRNMTCPGPCPNGTLHEPAREIS